jgi:hypothetical protein
MVEFQRDERRQPERVNENRDTFVVSDERFGAACVTLFGAGGEDRDACSRVRVLLSRARFLAQIDS